MSQLRAAHLDQLATIARLGSVSRAALALNMSQPTLSQNLVFLEELLGVKLFVRDGRGMRPTPLGERAIALAHDVQDGFSEIDRALSDLGETLAGQVRIGLPPSVSPLLTPHLVAAFQRAAPHVRLRISEGYSGTIQRALADGDVDIAVVYASPSGLAVPTERVLVERLMLIGAPSASIVSGLDVPFYQLDQLPMVLPSRSHGLRRLLDRASHRAGVALDIRLEIDALGPTKNLCINNGLFTILPSCAVSDEIAAGRLAARPIVEPDLERTLSLATTIAHPIGREVRAAVRLCMESIRELVRSGAWVASL